MKYNTLDLLLVAICSGGFVFTAMLMVAGA